MRKIPTAIVAALAVTFLLPSPGEAQSPRLTVTDTWVSVVQGTCVIFFTPSGELTQRTSPCTDRQQEIAEDEFDDWARGQGSSRSSRSASPASREDADWFVTEGARNNLEVLERPSMRARIVVDGIRDGTSVRNLGCERHESDTWCEIEVGRDRGWARIRYLQPDDSRRSSSRASSSSSSRENADWFRTEGARNNLEVMDRPSMRARIVVDGIRDGTSVRNLGCERHESDTWCEIEVGRDRGWARIRYLQPDDRGGSSSGRATGLSDRLRSERDDRGEEFFQVEVSGRLRLKATPSTDGRNVLDNVPNGTVVRSLGCERHGGESWCRVDVDGEVGWIRERWLRPY